MSVNEKMTTIADRVRGYNQETGKMSLDDMAKAIDRAVQSGITIAEELWKQDAFTTVKSDAFWDVFQANGTRTDYSYAFAHELFNDTTFTPKYKMNVTNAERMFLGSQSLTDLSGIDMDFSVCNNFKLTFQSSGATKIGDISTVSAPELFRTFLGCSVVEMGTFTVDEETIFNNPFAACNALETITFEGTIGQDLRIDWSPLNRASIESILNCLSKTATGKTLTLKKTAKEAAFTDEEWTTLTGTKTNWTISLV